MKQRLSLFVLLPLLALSTFAADPLPRRAMGGLAVGAGEGNTVVVRDAFPGLPAAKAGLLRGDLVVKVNGEAVRTTADVVSRLGARKSGDRVRIDYTRNGEARIAELTMQPWPMEKSDEFEVLYESVEAEGNRYRTILTKPKGDGPFPTVFLVQGLGCASIDNPPPDHSYRSLVDSLTRRGLATLRVDKPGVGDSQGGPCASAGFHKEVNAFRSGLASLKEKPFVDQKNVFLFGHSMGGIMAPLIAGAAPLRGIVVYGSVFGSWLEYSLDNQRRQMRLRGEPFEEIDDAGRDSERFLTLFYVQKQPLEKILAANPQWREAYPDGKTFTAGKEGKFFQELYDAELTKAWKATNAPVMAVWGASDYLTDARFHEPLAAAVNSWRPGTGRYVRLEGIDHWLRSAATQQESMRQVAADGGEYDDRLAQTIAAFVTEQKR